MTKNYNRLLTCLFVLLLAATGRAQQGVQQMTLARCDDGSELKGDFISVPNGVKRMQSVPDLNMLCLTDNDDLVHIYQLPSLKLICDVKPKEGEFSQVNRDGYLTTKSSLLISRTRPNFYNFNNEKLWTCNQNALISDRKNNVVICEAEAQSSDVVAYDMTFGKELWRHSISAKKHYPWLGAYRFDDRPEIYYMMADSLWRLNILTGEARTAAFEGGCSAGLKGMFNVQKPGAFPSQDWNREAVSSLSVSGEYVTGTNSNWLVKGDSIFVADVNHVYCYDRDLNMLWSTPLPEGVGGKSLLSIDGDVVRMMGFGVAFQNSVTVKNGKPFLATFDRKTGKQLQFSLMEMDRRLIGGTFVKGRAYWQDRKAFYFTNEGETTATRINWKPKTHRQKAPDYPDRVICDTVWTLEGGELHPVCTNADQLVVELYNKDVYLVHDDGSAQMLNADSVYFRDDARLFSTNGEIEPKQGEQPCHYVVVAPGSRRVRKSFPFVGEVSIDWNGYLFFNLKTGVGVKKLCDND
jgi:hypothetical protein